MRASSTRSRSNISSWRSPPIPGPERRTMIILDVNGQRHALDIPEDMPLLWAIRDVLGMTGTKFGCGAGLCGACTVHIEGGPARSCITPASAAKGKRITTIEAIGATPTGKKIKAAWLAMD